MKYYVQFMLICLFAVIGEAISTFFKLPIPGSIIGLFLLLIALQLKWIRLRHIHAVAEFLIANMTIPIFASRCRYYGTMECYFSEYCPYYFDYYGELWFLTLW